MSNPSNPIELSGLDGANPLGFMAALGTLVTLHNAGDGSTRLGWKRSATWVPVLDCEYASDPTALTKSIAAALLGKRVSGDAEKKRQKTQQDFDAAKRSVKDKRDDIKQRRLRSNDREAALEVEVAPLLKELHEKRQAWLSALKDAVTRPELAIGKHIDCTDEEYRDHTIGFLAGANHGRRETLDLLAAFGSDACVEKSGRITPTPFCFITGSGHQYFLDTVRQLMDTVTPERIQATLFDPWTYRDEKLSMRWDPLEDRRYALMDRDPTASDNKSRTVWMANLLAYRALVLFPSAPRGRYLATAGWNRIEDAFTFTWPIWDFLAGLDIIRSILQLPELIASNPDCSSLRARGIVAAFRAKRIQVGNPPLHKINFSPARGIL